MTTEATVLGQLYAVGHDRRDRRSSASSGATGCASRRSSTWGPAAWSCPRVDSADDVARGRSTGCASRREGQRGIALGGRGQGFGQVGHADIGTLNDVVVGVFQIENAAAVADADAIAALPGADVLFVGPADLSHSLGVPGRFDDPTYLDASAAVVAACAATARRPGSSSTTARSSAAPPRARVPVHRARLGPRVRGRRRPGHGRGRPRARARGPNAAAGPTRRRGAPAGAGARPDARPGLGEQHAGEDQRAADQLDGRQGEAEQQVARARSSRSARRC